MTPSPERSYYAVSVVGPDRPGIVAGITEALYRLGCNIADSSCAMLASEFAMILIVSHPKPFTKAQLLDELKPAGDRLGMTLSLRSLHDGEEQRRAFAGEICQITVYGADQPGIVYRVTSALAARQINILDLQTKLVGSDDAPVYVMLLEATLPDAITPDDVEQLLANLRAELQVEIGIRIVTPVEL
ncbi:MAG: ACT domain-containing protein [Trichlorobacter sp.]|jgi:glycine cleavage system transcriptional repressor